MASLGQIRCLNSYKRHLEALKLIRKLKPLASYALNKTGISNALSTIPPKWRILMYHRIIEPEKSKLCIQAGMYVRPETFRLQMQYLAKNCNVLALDDLVEKVISKQKLPKRSIAITFDDGWVDNYESAFPILKELNLPATIFLPTSYINTNKLFWTDKFAVLSLLFREQDADVQFLSKSSAVEKSVRKLFRSDSDFNTSLEDAILNLKQVDTSERDEIINALKDFLEFDPEMLIPPQFLNWRQIEQMQASSITFGSHSHKHQQLGKLNAASVTEDVDNSLAILKAKLKKPSQIFCYPEGSYSGISQAALGKLPIKAVVANKWLKLKPTSPQIIGRIGIHQDISANLHLFKNRIWCNKIF
jgi:peptidoglycan/xylan/chitin deacetylase (PgdA/CDA1 family)